LNATIQQQLQNAAATNANNNNNNNNLSAKFKNIKTISVSTAQSNINNNQLNTQKFLNSKFKNHQFIASQLNNNNNNNNNNNGQPIKINSSLSNRLRIEEIKKQQQEHVAKQLLLRANELTIDSNESHNNNHNHNHNNTIKEELKSESEPKEKSGAESEIATSELHISTKTGKKKHLV
jgi:hypothetical protein